MALGKGHETVGFGKGPQLPRRPRAGNVLQPTKSKHAGVSLERADALTSRDAPDAQGRVVRRRDADVGVS